MSLCNEGQREEQSPPPWSYGTNVTTEYKWYHSTHNSLTPNSFVVLILRAGYQHYPRLIKGGTSSWYGLKIEDKECRESPWSPWTGRGYARALQLHRTYLYKRPYCLAIDSVLIVVRIFPMTGNISVWNYVLTVPKLGSKLGPNTVILISGPAPSKNHRLMCSIKYYDIIQCILLRKCCRNTYTK